MTKAMAQVNSEPCRPRRHLLRCTGARAMACENGSAVLEAWTSAMVALSFASALRDWVFARICPDAGKRHLVGPIPAMTAEHRTPSLFRCPRLAAPLVA